MSATRISINFAAADAMVNSFKQGGERIQDTMSAVLNISSMLEEGALLGEAGESFVEGIRNQFIPSLNKLHAKFEELAKDVQDAKNKMIQEDTDSGRQFS